MISDERLGELEALDLAAVKADPAAALAGIRELADSVREAKLGLQEMLEATEGLGDLQERVIRSAQTIRELAGQPRWQDVSTAGELMWEGECFVVLDGLVYVGDASGQDHFLYFDPSELKWLGCKPTHWMPVPDPPATP